MYNRSRTTSLLLLFIKKKKGDNAMTFKNAYQTAVPVLPFFSEEKKQNSSSHVAASNSLESCASS